MSNIALCTAEQLLAFVAGRRFHTVLIDPPWRFQNRTGKVAPEHRRLRRYGTLALDEIRALPVAELVADGRQPAELQLDDLLEGFPLEWDQQRSTLRGC